MLGSPAPFCHFWVSGPLYIAVAGTKTGILATVCFFRVSGFFGILRLCDVQLCWQEAALNEDGTPQAELTAKPPLSPRSPLYP